MTEEYNEWDSGMKMHSHKVDKKFSFQDYINKNLPIIVLILLTVMLVVAGLNIYSTTTANVILNEKAKEIEEFNKPVKIQLSVIDCEDCSDIDSIVESVKSKNVEILEEKNLDYNSEEAKGLIEKYGIQKLPSILIFGEIDNKKITFNNFELNDDALVFNGVSAPYFNIIEDKIKGEVSIIEIVDSSCEDCVSVGSIADILGQSGVLIKDWKKVEYNSPEGEDYINKFEIKKVPVILISEDIDYYEELSQGLAQLNLEKKQGYYSIHSTNPPYRDLIKNKVVGLVDFIMLTDESCSECYDVELNKQIFQRFGLTIKSEETYDINSAKAKQLISKYKIEKVPIVILSPDANEYSTLMQVWNQVGTVENDNWLVMRNPEIIGTSRNIQTGEIIKSE